MHFPLTLLEFLGELCAGFFVGTGWAIGHWLVSRILK
jgi:hypothetical protein